MKFLDMFRNWQDMVEFDAGAVIFEEGSMADVMYVILSGEIELTLRGEHLDKEKAGGVIGEMAMINSGTRNATAIALTNVRLARMDHDQFKDFIRKNSDFSMHVMAVLANRLRAVDRFMSARI